MQILYATDGSAGALAGADLLTALALEGTSQIKVLTVQERREEEAEEQAALAAAQERLTGTAASVTTVMRRGNAAEEILEEAHEHPTDLVVVGTTGQSAIARFLMGSVAERVTEHASCPVLLARPLHGKKLDRVLLGTDGSECAARAAAWLQTLPLPSECEVRLMTVVTPLEAVYASRMARIPSMAEQLIDSAQREQEEAGKQLKELAATFDGSGWHVVTEVRENEAASGLIEAAGEQAADLLVVGSQGLSRMERFLLGGVPERVMRYAPCSVLVVK